MRLKLKNRGDTIIEVLLALALLTSVLFTACGVTNRSTQTLAAARDRTLMVNAAKDQAELIKSLWSKNKEYFNNNSLYPPTAITNQNPCSQPQANQWHLTVNEESGDIAVQSGVRAVGAEATKSLWVQKVDSTDTTQPRYSDFYVRACWQSQVGGSQKDENTQIILRLNT